MTHRFERPRTRNDRRVPVRVSNAMTAARLAELATIVDEASPADHAAALRSFTNSSIVFAEQQTSRRIWAEWTGGAA